MVEKRLTIIDLIIKTMKKIKIFIAQILLLILLTSISPVKTQAQQISVSFQSFYDELSPYGSWINSPEYGYVWQPYDNQGFRPYSTNGHWVWSDEYEWIWVSDYNWGWAPFHYGRWRHDPFNGWLWVPGYQWSPAWVSWRTGGEYYGWAPLGPGIDIDYSFGNYSPPYDYWCFAPRRYITSHRIYDYCRDERENVTIIRNTKIINNYNIHGGRDRNIYVNGPRRFEAEQYTNQSIKPVNVRELQRPGRTAVNNNEVAIYRPKFDDRDKNSARPANVVPPVKTPPVKYPPVYIEPKNNPPVKTQPERLPPVYNHQNDNPPVRNMPERTQPVKTQPVYNPPVKEERKKDQ